METLHFSLPLGTLFVNVTGSCLLAIFVTNLLCVIGVLLGLAIVSRLWSAV